MAANYNNRTYRLTERFNTALKRACVLLVSTCGAEEAKNIIADAQEEYIKLIPQIPYIGDKNPMLLFLLPTVRCLAIYRVLRQHGYSTETAGQFIYESARIEINAIPKLVRRILGYLWFTSVFQNRLAKRAQIAKNKRYRDDFVFAYIGGAGRDFDFGVDYFECANCKFLQAQNAFELAPYICETDRLASEMLGWGLVRTKTIADGKEICDFRFTKGGKTNVQGSTVRI